jgi:hypothetical protein
MLNQAKQEASDGTSYSSSSSLLELKRANMQRFIQWLAEQGAVFPFIKMEVRERSRSMHATTGIGKGVLVLHVPRPLMITEELVKASSIGKLITAHTDRMSLSGYFSAFLLDGKREDSFWKPYTDVLPQDFSTHPLFFSEAELEELHGTDALRQIRNKLRCSRHEYKLLKSFLPPEKTFTHADYLWAKCAVMSRLHHLMIYQKKVQALTPLADMPDHDDNANVRWAGEASQGFIYTAKRHIEKGEEITIDYLPSNNSSAFRIYGFCPAGDVNNKTEIQLPPMQANHPFYAVAKDLGVARDDKRAFLVSANHDNAEAKAMFSYLRLFFAQNLSGVDPSKGSEADRSAIEFVSSSNEMNALSMLEMACDEQLEGFPTSVEDDEALLQSGNLPFNVSNAVRVRLGEKKC